MQSIKAVARNTKVETVEKVIKSLVEWLLKVI